MTLGRQAGLGVVLGSAIGGAMVTLVFRSVALGAVVAALTLACQAALVLRHARRVVHLTAPVGHVMTTAYDKEGRLTLTTAVGTGTFEAGSIDRVRRTRSTVAVRFVPGRAWTLLPAQLLTEDDLAFLLGRIRTTGNPATAARGLPLVHVVTPESQRGVQATVTGMVWRSADGVMSTIGVLIFAAWAALAPGLVSLVLASAMSLALIALLAGPALRIRRALPVGELIMADVTEKGLVLDQGRERLFLPWSSLRSVRVTRHAVVLAAGAGRSAVVPRSLFPAGDLERLCGAVRDAPAG